MLVVLGLLFGISIFFWIKRKSDRQSEEAKFVTPEVKGDSARYRNLHAGNFDLIDLQTPFNLSYTADYSQRVHLTERHEGLSSFPPLPRTELCHRSEARRALDAPTRRAPEPLSPASDTSIVHAADALPDELPPRYTPTASTRSATGLGSIHLETDPRQEIDSLLGSPTATNAVLWDNMVTPGVHADTTLDLAPIRSNHNPGPVVLPAIRPLRLSRKRHIEVELIHAQTIRRSDIETDGTSVVVERDVEGNTNTFGDGSFQRASIQREVVAVEDTLPQYHDI